MTLDIDPSLNDLIIEMQLTEARRSGMVDIIKYFDENDIDKNHPKYIKIEDKVNLLNNHITVLVNIVYNHMGYKDVEYKSVDFVKRTINI